MANRECFGTFFKAGGREYYRCLKHGEVVLAEKLLPEGPATCPICERPVRANNLGDKDHTIITSKYVILENGCGWKVELPAEEE